MSSFGVYGHPSTVEINGFRANFRGDFGLAMVSRISFGVLRGNPHQLALCESDDGATKEHPDVLLFPSRRLDLVISTFAVHFMDRPSLDKDHRLTAGVPNSISALDRQLTTTGGA